MRNADSVKIVLNGKTIGGQKVDPYEMNTWYVAPIPFVGTGPIQQRTNAN